MSVATREAPPERATATSGPAAGGGGRWSAGSSSPLGLAAWWLVPLAVTHLTTVSTDDAYVAGHVTLVAPRVAGQVDAGPGRGHPAGQGRRPARRARPQAVPGAVRPEGGGRGPGARPTCRRPRPRPAATEATARGRRWQLQTAIEQVDNQVALLKARVAALHSQRGDPGAGPGRPRPGPRSSAGPRPSRRRNSTCAGRRSGWPRPRPARPSSRCTRPASPSGCRPSPPAGAAARPGPGGHRPDLLRRPGRPGRPGPDRRPARPPAAGVERDPAAVPRPVLQATPRASRSSSSWSGS